MTDEEKVQVYEEYLQLIADPTANESRIKKLLNDRRFNLNKGKATIKGADDVTSWAESNDFFNMTQRAGAGLSRLAKHALNKAGKKLF